MSSSRRSRDREQGQNHWDVPHPMPDQLPHTAPSTKNRGQEPAGSGGSSSQKPDSGERGKKRKKLKEKKKGEKKRERKKKGSQSSLTLSRDKNTAPPVASAKMFELWQRLQGLSPEGVFPASPGVPSIYGMRWISLKHYKASSTNANPISLPLPVKTSGQQKRLGTFPPRITVFTEFGIWPCERGLGLGLS